MTDSPAAIGYGFLAFALLVLIVRLVQVRATTPARPQSVTPTGLGTGQEHCSVAFCDDEPTVRIYASDEWWDFCQEHGIPYLTSELAS